MRPKQRVYPPPYLFWSRVEKADSGCWMWTGYTTGANGHPAIIHLKKRFHARPWAWIVVKGYQAQARLANTCGQRTCVNPDHMYELGTAQTCGKGHPMLTEQDIYIKPSGYRECRRCIFERQQGWDRRAANTRRHEDLSEEQQKRLRTSWRESKRRERLANKIRQEALCWSPSKNRWMMWDGQRWVAAGYAPEDGKAHIVALNRYLRANGVDLKHRDWFLRKLKEANSEEA